MSRRVYTIVKIDVFIAEMYGLYEDLDLAKQRAKEFSLADAGGSEWVVYENPGYGRWTAVGPVYQRHGDRYE